MISENVWRSILSAPSSSEAVERAAQFSVATLYQSRLPWAYEDLSSRSQANIRAVSRAFDVTIDGVSSDGWASWAPAADDARLSYGWEDVPVDVDVGDCEEREDQQEAIGTSAENVSTSAALPIPEVTSAKRNGDYHDEMPEGMDIVGDLKDLRARTTKLVQSTDREPDANEIHWAEAVRTWAQQAPHTAPSSEAVTSIRNSAVASKLLKMIVLPEDSPTIRSAIVGIFSEDVGSTFASQVMNTLVIPYIATLKAPASREMMQAIVKFSELHWRTAVSLYAGADSEGQMNGAMAEVLVRVAAVLNTDAAVQSLRAFAGLRWGEDGIRVLETLVGKCKEESDIAEVIVSSMERNILGLESSVRFGKLLFTVARDIPGVAESYEQEMESIVGRSKVFLAKRALKILKEKKGKAKPG